MGRFLRAVVGCSGYGWADNSVGVGVCCVRRFLRTAGGPVAWSVLGTVGGCCLGVLRAVGPEGLLWAGSVGVRLVGWRIFCAQVGAYFRVRLGSLVCVVICGARVRWVFGSSGVGVFCARLRVYPVCYEVDSSPLFNFNRIFPPFPGACRNLCAETSYLRGQCLCLATLGYAILCAGHRGYNA